MLAIQELDRLAAPSPQPHAVAVEKSTVYISSRATRNIDVVDAATWTKTDEIQTPGMPWGLTCADGELVMTCGEGLDDTRRLRRYALSGTWRAGVLDAPNDTGSHLAVWRGAVLLGQWYDKRLLLLERDGAIAQRFDAPHEIAGVAVVNDVAYLISTDDEDDGEYWLTALDLHTGRARDVALVPFHARGLSFDGVDLWTNHRAADQVVRFRMPE